MVGRSHPRYGELRAWLATGRVPTRVYAEVCYRVAGPRHTTAAEIVSGVGAFKVGGRWNAAEAMNAVYVSTDAAVAMDEALEHGRYRRLPQYLGMPKVIVSVDVSVQAVVDLTDARVNGTMPISLADLMAEDWRAVMDGGDEASAQAAGRAAFEVGLGGLIVPSKARPGGVNVVVFPDRLTAADRLTVRNPDDLLALGK